MCKGGVFRLLMPCALHESNSWHWFFTVLGCFESNIILFVADIQLIICSSISWDFVLFGY